ncbi:ABC transporter ATP-binding protein [Ectobacillus panaciterrae]|uniref:ABC transporter ATP-binding protein n=1 Tax=Ectobacillus panaciterrae TaxID=363872 RepID=UPI0003FD7DCA|nr:ABC transporter ATP-binding protein [Ectobacillus panaciterrae]
MVLSLNNVTINHQSGKSIVKGLDLKINEGEIMAIIGESGSGKSVTAFSIFDLLPKQLFIADGHILFRGQKLSDLSQREKRKLRGKEMAFIFQDYTGSLSPFRTVGSQMMEMARVHTTWSKKEIKQKVMDALLNVQLNPNKTFRSYSFQLSGGQRQRIAIAQAMLLKPSLIIADEITTALDPMTTKHVQQLLLTLKKETDCAIIYITHDLGSIEHFADKVAVMYGGQLMEQGETDRIFVHASHPYTKLLMQAKPPIEEVPSYLETVPGEPGKRSETGCPFSLRCSHAVDSCMTEDLKKRTIDENHDVYCHVVKEQKKKKTVFV